VFSHLRTLTTWHCSHSPAARRCCSNRSISPACRAHSSKPAAARLLLHALCRVPSTSWVKKTRHQTLSHNFTNYYPIFKIFFTSGHGSKFATNSCLNIPSRFKHVAKLPCEIWMSENGIILKYVLQLMMNHKVVRQHVWGVVGYLMSPCYKFPTES